MLINRRNQVLRAEWRGMDVAVLGAGLVGNWIVKTLASQGYRVTAIDSDPTAIKKLENIANTIHQCVDDELIKSLEAKVIVNALPGRIGHKIRKILLESGNKIADLAFTPEDPREMNDIAKKHESCLIYDVGVAPGLSNLLLKEANRRHGKLTMGQVRVGGNPSISDGEWSYMAPFSPIDVIEEYTRPARIIRNGEIIQLPALSERKLFHVEGRGEMEAFLTDGLRSVLDTVEAEELTEATVRWPGHIEKYIENKNKLSESQLVDAWAWDSEKSEFTWMEVLAQGKGKTRWILDDEGRDSGSSMARTTGAITCAVVKYLLEEDAPIGIYPPESVTSNLLERSINEYALHGIKLIDENNSF